MVKDQSMAANKRDYYEILGISRSATDEEIKKSFRRLAKQYHPDANKEQGAEARFIEINEAYEVLSDQQKRTAYDRYGHAGVGAGAGRAWRAASGSSDESALAGPECSDGGSPPTFSAQTRSAWPLHDASGNAPEAADSDPHLRGVEGDPTRLSGSGFGGPLWR